MKTIVRRQLASLALAGFATVAQAAPASAQSVEALLVLTRTEALMGSMYANLEQVMRESMRQAIGDKQLTPAQQRAFDAAPRQFVATMRQEMSWAKLKPRFVEIYRETFSQEEIDGLTAFYRSPTGQAFIDKMPVVMQKSMAVGQAQMQALMPKLQAAIERATAEVRNTK